MPLTAPPAKAPVAEALRVYITQPKVRFHECLYRGALGTIRDGCLVLDCGHVWPADVCSVYGSIKEESHVRRPRSEVR